MGVMIDAGGWKFEEDVGGLVKELGVKTFLEATKSAPSVLKGDKDVWQLVTDLHAFLGKELFDKFRDHKDRLAQTSSATLKGVAALAKAASIPLKLADVIGGVGQVAQRLSGMVNESALETGFIQIGDPFALQILAITPPQTLPGGTVTLTFRGPKTMGAFRGDRAGDAVELSGNDLARLPVLTVVGPDSTGVQTLTVKVPESVTVGDYQLSVSTHGRRGEKGFKVEDTLYVSSMVPSVGFAATNNFGGSSFEGTEVELLVVGGSTSDKVLFSGRGTTTLEPTQKEYGTGGVLRMKVPAGAVTGPIRIQHTTTSGKVLESRSPSFTVLTPPVIENYLPEHGPVGTSVTFDVSNVLEASGTLRVTMPDGRNMAPLVRGNKVAITVPLGTETGPITIATPAGKASVVFTVDPGLSQGATLNVASQLPFARACELASAEAPLVIDDEDVSVGANGTVVSLDRTVLEEGDFIVPDNGPKAPVRWPVGRVNHDRIVLSGDVTSNATLSGNGDTITGTGTLNGTLRITGHYNTIELDGVITGQVVIEGNYNRIASSVRFRNCPETALVIKGDFNTVEAARFETNRADAVSITGGKFNRVVARANGNRGNGITLTGGAEGNTVSVLTTIKDPSTGRLKRGSANLGHGVAIIGDALNNQVDASSGGNGLHGVYLSGEGVRGTRIPQFSTEENGGDGIRVESARGTVLGVNDGSNILRSIESQFNGGNGLVVTGAVTIEAVITCSGNRENGVLLTEAKGLSDQAHLIIGSAGFATNGNAKAGIRLEKATSGFQIGGTSGGVFQDLIGLEMDGETVTGNRVTGLRVDQAREDGVVLRGARTNRLEVTVSRCVGNGIVILGGYDNMLELNSSNGNGAAGVLVASGADHNRIGGALGRSSIRNNRNGVVLENGAWENVVEDLTISENTQAGVVMRGEATRWNKVLVSTIVNNGSEGLLITDGARFNAIGGETGPLVANVLGTVVQGNKLAGIRVNGANSSGNVVQHCLISTFSNQPTGVIVENGAADTLIQSCSFAASLDGIVIRNGALGTRVRANQFLFLKGAGVQVQDARGTVIGGMNPGDKNIIRNQPTGVVLNGGESTANRVEGNDFNGCTEDAITVASGAHHNWIVGNEIRTGGRGVRLSAASWNRIERNQIHDNEGVGVRFERGAQDNQLFDNQLTQNRTIGVSMDGPTTIRNTLFANSIFNHSGRGIALENGANKVIQPPRFTEFVGDTLIGSVDAPDGSQVEVFQDFSDEGERSVIVGLVSSGRFRIPMRFDPFLVGIAFRLNGTVTDTDGNTSEFSGLFQPQQSLGKLLFVSTREGNPDVYVAEASLNWSAPPIYTIQLTAHTASDTQPSLSPDGSQVAFVSDRDGNPEIYVMSAARFATPVRLTTSVGVDHQPSWTPDGTHVVFVGEAGGKPKVFTVKSDGTGLVPLGGGLEANWPSFSPSGRNLVCSTQRDGHWHVSIANADGSGVVELTSGTADDTQPTWSPDGQWIAFTSNREGRSQVYAMRSDGTAVTRLTPNDSSNHSAAWLAGGSRLVYVSERTGHPDLYLLDRSTGASTRLTVDAASNFDPSTGGR